MGFWRPCKSFYYSNRRPFHFIRTDCSCFVHLFSTYRILRIEYAPIVRFLKGPQSLCDCYSTLEVSLIQKQNDSFWVPSPRILIYPSLPTIWFSGEKRKLKLKYVILRWPYLTLGLTSPHLESCVQIRCCSMTSSRAQLNVRENPMGAIGVLIIELSFSSPLSRAGSTSNHPCVKKDIYEE